MSYGKIEDNLFNRLFLDMLRERGLFHIDAIQTLTSLAFLWVRRLVKEVVVDVVAVLRWT